MILAIVCAAMGWVFAVFIVITTTRDKDEMAVAYERALAVEQARVDDLIRQVQVNAQGMPHYPQIGPLPQEPEKRYIGDDTGLIVFEDTEDDADFAQASNV